MVWPGPRLLSDGIHTSPVSLALTYAVILVECCTCFSALPSFDFWDGSLPISDVARPEVLTHIFWNF